MIKRLPRYCCTEVKLPKNYFSPLQSCTTLSLTFTTLMPLSFLPYPYVQTCVPWQLRIRHWKFVSFIDLFLWKYPFCGPDDPDSEPSGSAASSFPRGIHFAFGQPLCHFSDTICSVRISAICSSRLKSLCRPLGQIPRPYLAIPSSCYVCSSSVVSCLNPA